MYEVEKVLDPPAKTWWTCHGFTQRLGTTPPRVEVWDVRRRDGGWGCARRGISRTKRTSARIRNVFVQLH